MSLPVAVTAAPPQAVRAWAGEPYFLASARAAVANLRALAALSTSKDPEEAAGGKSVLAWLESLQELLAQKKIFENGEFVLQLWNEAAAKGR